MLTCAAIWYTVEQNEPSSPFLLELDCPETPTKDELERALIANAANAAGHEGYDDHGNLMPFEQVVAQMRVGTDDYSDLVVGTEDSDNYLFIGLPGRLDHLKAQFKSRSELGF
jgi:hypothetical protein